MTNLTEFKNTSSVLSFTYSPLPFLKALSGSNSVNALSRCGQSEWIKYLIHNPTNRASYS